MKSLLKFSFVYNIFGVLIGVRRMSDILSRDYIKSDRIKRILDLCCGPAGILPYLEYSEYIGVDISEKYICDCNEKYGNLKNASFFLDDVNTFMRNVPSNKQFDIVLFLGGMHHIDDNSLINILRNVKKVLAPGGKVVTFDGCFEPHLSWITKKTLAADRGQFVRTKEEWLKIFLSVFEDHKYVVRNDLLRIPYNHIIFYK